MRCYRRFVSYVSRRIRVSDDADNWREISDIEFAALDGPLILVGEPGSGKSDTASAICTLRQGVLLEAYRVASSVPLPQLATGSYTVIDGFDEVPASSAHQPIELALERLHSQGIEAFVITAERQIWPQFKRAGDCGLDRQEARHWPSSTSQ